MLDHDPLTRTCAIAAPVHRPARVTATLLLWEHNAQRRVTPGDPEIPEIAAEGYSRWEVIEDP